MNINLFSGNVREEEWMCHIHLTYTWRKVYAAVRSLTGEPLTLMLPGKNTCGINDLMRILSRMDLARCCYSPDLEDNRVGTRRTQTMSRAAHGGQNNNNGPTEAGDLPLSKAVSVELIIGRC